MQFKKATKHQSKLRMALQGPSGSGKTRSALEIGRHLGQRLAVIDSEHGSAAKYAGVNGLDFDVCEVTDDYHPDKLVKLLEEAAKEYDVVVVDSLTHWWNGPGGFLELVDREVERMRARGGKPDSFAAWKVVDPVYKRLVQAILASKAHVIVTMRAKQSYEKDQENGRTVIRKVGLAPEMRDGFQFEMDIEGMIDIDHKLVIGKTRCEAIDGRIYTKPGKDLASTLLAWLSDGAPAKPAEPQPPPWTGTRSSTRACASSRRRPPTWPTASRPTLRRTSPRASVPTRCARSSVTRSWPS